ncbi:transposase [Arachidicoccus sp.]
MPNRKNGKARKTVKTSNSEFALETSWDRNGSFEPTLMRFLRHT